MRGTSLSSGSIRVLQATVTVALVVLAACGTVLSRPGNDDFAKAIERSYPAVNIESIDVSDVSFFCPQECERDQYNFTVAGAGVITEDTYRPVGTAGWLPECGLDDDARDFAPRVQGRDTMFTVSAYRLQPAQGVSFTLSGSGAIGELSEGGWNLGRDGLDFGIDDPDIRFVGTARAEVDGVHFVLDTPEFERLCELTVAGIRAGAPIEGDWPPVSLLDS